MKVFISNVMELGFSGIILWAMFLFLITAVLDWIYCRFEKFIGIENQVYWYDITTWLIMLGIFIAGVYFYK